MKSDNSPAQPPDEVRELAADIVSYIFDDYPDNDQVRGDAELEVARRIARVLREAEQRVRREDAEIASTHIVFSSEDAHAAAQAIATAILARIGEPENQDSGQKEKDI